MVEAEVRHQQRRVQTLARAIRTTRVLLAQVPRLPKNASEEERRQHRRRQARNSGLLAEGLGLGALIESLGEAARFELDEKTAEELGDLHPSDVDRLTGAWGYGIRKLGPGSGDGRDWGTVKAGPYDLGLTANDLGASYVANALTRPHRVRLPEVRNHDQVEMAQGISYDELRGRLGMKRTRLRRCFDDGSPAALRVNLEVDAQGRIVSAYALEVEDAPTQDCLQGALLSLQLTQGRPSARVTLEEIQVRL